MFEKEFTDQELETVEGEEEMQKIVALKTIQLPTSGRQLEIGAISYIEIVIRKQ